MKSIEIAGRKIGPDFPPYTIAEISANHNGSIDNAFKLIAHAKDAGADAVKIQSYTADTITLNSSRPEFRINSGLWEGKTLYQLYEQAHLPWDWHRPLFDYARSLGITIFSSPFDSTAVDLLESLDAPAYKIASFEAIDLPLIKYVASMGKPMIISTGMANEREIEDAVNAATQGGCKDLALLHCVSGYPAPSIDYNLKTIPDLAGRFSLVTGLSDHTIDNTTAIAATALGSCIVEKHFTLDRNGGGPDDSFSLEPRDLRALVQGVRTAWEALGSVNHALKPSELENVQFRRSLYFVQPLKAGDTITHTSVRSVRPGFGLAPKYFEKIVGTKVSIDVDWGTPVTAEALSISLHGSQ
jgi:pseudaminic acid synthase